MAEGTYPDHESQASVGRPGIVTDEQVAGRRRVAEAVHDRGGRIVLQVVHGGRVTHPDTNGGRRVVAPSAIAIDGVARTSAGRRPHPVPHALTTAEVGDVVRDFRRAAERRRGRGWTAWRSRAPTATCCTSSYRDDVLATYGALLDRLRPLGPAHLSVLTASRPWR